MWGIRHLSNLSNLSNLWGWGSWALMNESFTLQATHWTVLNPADSTTYYLWQGIFSNIRASDARIYVQKKCILKKIFLSSKHTAWSSEQSTISILVNGTTSYTVTSTWIDSTASINTANNTSLSIPLNKGDYFCIKWVTPAWATNPTSVWMNAVCRLESSPASPHWTYEIIGTCVCTNPADSTAYYFDDSNFWTTAAQARIYIPKTGTVTGATLYIRSPTVSTSEQFTIALRLNNTSNTSITTTATFDAISTVYTKTDISLSVTEGDYLCRTYTAPARVTNPINQTMTFNITVTY